MIDNRISSQTADRRPQTESYPTDNAIAAANHRSQSGAATILLIDDDPSVLESLRRVLATEEWTVVTAGNGGDGLARLCERKVDLIITDLRMAGITGWDILFHEALQHPNLPIFVVSALSINALGGADKFAAEYFRKPLEMEALLAAVRRHLRKGMDGAPQALAAGIGHAS